MNTKTARGKVILFGEHAVVYGVPAIAVGIERGARAHCVPLGAGPSTLTLPQLNLRVTPEDATSEGNAGLLARAFSGLLDVTRAAGARVDSVAIEAEAELPPGGGLGCSAALGVAIAGALDPTAPADVLASRADAWERVFHGNPSGVDAAVAALGGCVLFERKAGAQPVISRIRVPGIMHLCVGDTGHASSTRTMVEAVARLRERRPQTTKQTFDAIEAIVKNARLAIEAADRVALGQLLDLNQMLLAGLFVSSTEIEHMCASARAAGALGAKLTGAGGGGCVVALVDTAESGARVLEAWKRDGFDGFLTTFGGVALDLGAQRPPALAEGAP